MAEKWRYPMSTRKSDTARLKRISRIGEWICIAAMVLLAGYCAFLIADPAEGIAVLQREIPGQHILPDNTVLLIAGLVALVPVLLFLYALWQARNLFRLIGRGEFLSSASQTLMLRLARMAVALSIVTVVARSLVVVLMTSANPPGQKMLIIGIGSGEIASVIIAVLFFTFALLMKESAAIHAENQSII
jgi:Protein of unknown function (DUF2975)